MSRRSVKFALAANVKVDVEITNYNGWNYGEHHMTELQLIKKSC